MKHSPIFRFVWLRTFVWLSAGLGLTATSLVQAQTDGNWNVNNAGNWSSAGNWTSNPTVPGGTGSVVGLTFNINAGRTVTIDTTPRTVGILNIGDTDGTHRYTLAASGGASLIMNNGGAGAQINQLSTSFGDLISAPISLADNLTVSNAADTGNFVISGGITGTGNVALRGNGSGVTLVQTASVNHAGTLTNSGVGGGAVTVSSVIGTNVTGVIQDSATSQLTLSGANTYTSGTTIRQGTLVVGNNSALGTGTVTLGHTSGSADATLLIGSYTVANNVLVQAGSSGTLTIATNGAGAARPTGDFTLNNHLTLNVSSGGQSGRNTGAYLLTTGTISGSGNLTLDVDGNLSTTNNTGNPQMDTLVVNSPVTTTGTIYNTGSGSGRAAIGGNISNAAGLIQDSTTSMLSLGGDNTYSGATQVNAGVLRISSLNALSLNSVVTISSGATLQLGTSSSTAVHVGQTLNLSGFGTSYSYGALDSTNNANYGGQIVLLDDAAVSSDLATTTLTLSGGVSGAGYTLTTSGVGGVTITASIDTGPGGLTKQGTGTLTLSAANSFTGVTTLENGTLLLNHADALGGGGAITFDGGTIRHSSVNELNLGGRIVNSTGPISVDTNSRLITYSGIDASNTGGLTKLGSGRLTLSGTNQFSGPIAVNSGVLAVTDSTAIPSGTTVFLDTNGALNSGGAYADIQSWLDSGVISTASTGAISLTSASSEDIDFTGYAGLSLGATTSLTYTGTLTPAGTTYRLGGGGSTLTLSGNNALTGARSLVVSGSNVTLTGTNDLTGATTVNGATLALGGVAGNVANSDVTVNSGGTLAITSATSSPAVTRATSVMLNQANLTVTGNGTADSTDTITGNLTVGSGGNSIVTLVGNASRNTLLTANSLARNAGGTGVIRGTNLGQNAFGTANTANISLSAPSLVGGDGLNTTDGGIFVGFVGDTLTSGAGTGYGSTGGLLTYSATNGVRLLTGSEYKTTITDGQTQLDNVQLSSTSGTVTTTVNSATTINSLSIRTTAASDAVVVVDGSGTLTINSGMIHYASVTANGASTISNSIDFNGREGVVMVGGSGALTLSGVLSNTGGNGLTFAGNRITTLSGTAANTYTGTTTLNGGTLTLAKTEGMNAITGDLVVNSGIVTMTIANQIADSANVTMNGGVLNLRSETIQNMSAHNGASVRAAGANFLTLNGDLTLTSGASFSTPVAGSSVPSGFSVAGVTNLSDGGSINLGRSYNLNGLYDSTGTLGTLNITNSASGAYTVITIDYGSGLAQSGGKLILAGDVTFTGNSTNANTVLIDALKGTGRQGVAALEGARTFNVGEGAAKVDLRVTAGIEDGITPGSLIKTGAGALEFTGVNTYTGSTLVTAGTLIINGSSASATTVSGGSLGGSGAIANSVTIGDNGTLAPGNSPGILHTGDLSLTGMNSTLAMEIAGTSAGEYDQVSVTGSVDLSGNGKIEITLLSFIPQPTDVFFLILNDGVDAINGTLYGLAQGSTFDSGGYSWQVSYFGNSATDSFLGGNDLALRLAVIPEPTTWLLLTGSLLVLVCFRRRRTT